jgi:D-amino-acid dehydrogenase
MYDAIVVGGGIVGLSTAYHLVASGARTLLVDRGDAGQATAAGAGILTPATATSESDAWLTFALAAVEYYPILVRQLEAEGAGDTGYAPAGQLIVSISDDEDQPFTAARDIIFARL